MSFGSRGRGRGRGLDVAVGVDTAAGAAAGPHNLPIPLAGAMDTLFVFAPPMFVEICPLQTSPHPSFFSPIGVRMMRGGPN